MTDPQTIDWQQPAQMLGEFINEQYRLGTPAYAVYGGNKLFFLRVVYPKGSEQLRKPKGNPGDLITNWCGHPTTFVICGDNFPLHVTHVEYAEQLLSGPILKMWVEQHLPISLSEKNTVDHPLKLAN